MKKLFYHRIIYRTWRSNSDIICSKGWNVIATMRIPQKQEGLIINI